MSNRKFDDFDRFASKYRDGHTDNIKEISGVDSNYFSEYKIKEISKHEKNTQNSIILDFGCGDGNSAQYFMKHLSPESYYGIDISPDSIEVAKQNSFEQCFFQEFDGEVIPFDDEVFDIVFIAGVLHHVDANYHKNILSECYRVMKKGGRIYIFEHNHLNPITRKIVNDCEFDVDAKLVTLSNVKRTIKDAGFKELKASYTIFFPRKFGFKLLLNLERYLKWCPLGGQYYVKAYK